MTSQQHEQFMGFARTGNVAALRNLIHIALASDDLTTMTYQTLRERASRLRIPLFNKMHKGDLIRNIQVTEEVLRDKLMRMPRPKINGADVAYVYAEVPNSPEFSWRVT